MGILNTNRMRIVRNFGNRVLLVQDDTFQAAIISRKGGKWVTVLHEGRVDFTNHPNKDAEFRPWGELIKGLN